MRTRAANIELIIQSKVSPHMLKVILVTFLFKGGKTTPRGILASRLARNKIPTATPMFLGSNVSMVLSVTLPDETRSQKSEMAAKIMQLHVSQQIYMITAQCQRQ